MKTILLKDAVALIPDGASVMIGAKQHTAKCQPKIARQCSLPITAVRPVDLVVAEPAVVAFPGGRATLLETAPAVTVDQVREATEAELAVSERVCTMAL